MSNLLVGVGVGCLAYVICEILDEINEKINDSEYKIIEKELKHKRKQLRETVKEKEEKLYKIKATAVLKEGMDPDITFADIRKKRHEHVILKQWGGYCMRCDDVNDVVKRCGFAKFFKVDMTNIEKYEEKKELIKNPEFKREIRYFTIKLGTDEAVKMVSLHGYAFKECDIV